MFGVGTGELIVILIIAILILGPKEIPKVARTIGRAMREVRRVKDDLTKNIEFENDTSSGTESEKMKKTTKDTNPDA